MSQNAVGQDLHNADESTPYPTSFMDAYTETKMLQEQLVLQANGPEFKTVALRPHGIFGPRDHTVSEMVKKAKAGQMKFIIGNGLNIVDFTHVRNVTYGHILAANHLQKGNTIAGKPYNLTNNQPLQFWVFVGSILSRLGYTPPHIHLSYWFVYALSHLCVAFSLLLQWTGLGQWTPFLTPFKVALSGTHHYYSCASAQRDFDYQPVVTLEQGIDDVVKFFQSEEEDKNEVNK